ncbi:hypothetical protein WJX84_003905 [Apatococcus fuscideae]|uniref:Uncharacterized protein n=1 Tax=Apatococcus fuscideae TaxID=2026836 RepID=A0AAW1RMC9_9CHLO
MLPEGLQWDRAIHADVLQQAIGTASDTSDSEGPGSPPGIESSPLHPTNQGQGTSTDGPWGPWVQGGFEGQLLTADGTAGDSDFDEIMTIQGIFRDQTVDFLTLHRKELLVNYSEDVVSMRDVE